MSYGGQAAPAGRSLHVLRSLDEGGWRRWEVRPQENPSNGSSNGNREDLLWPVAFPITIAITITDLSGL